MEKPRFQSTPAEGWRRLDDPTFGRRAYRFDSSGRPVEARLPGGESLSFAHDAEGVLRRLEGSDGTSLEVMPAWSGMTLRDGAGATGVAFDAAGGLELTRDGSSLRIERDAQGRVSRVRLPGSRAALVYHWREDRCAIGPEDSGPAVEIAWDGATTRYRIGEEGWDELASPGRLELTPQGHAMPSLTVEVDLLGRTTARRRSDGRYETFERDERGRLLRHRRLDASEHEYRYSGRNLVEERGGGLAWCREVDCGGRVTRLTRPNGGHVEYSYDAAGRRIARSDVGGTTRYGYDVLGRLTRVERPDGARIEMTYDGLGRRLGLSNDGRLSREHRDADGRLWAVTHPDGRALHSFIWWQDTLLARIDGPVGDPIAQAFICEPGGTPLACLERDAAGHLAGRWLDAPPYGAVEGPASPVLYGHVGDPETGLVHFGGRDLDPELGVFLTPDPWHGGEDDPRLLGGLSASELRLAHELPAEGWHPYALCQYDPLGRVDRDGHAGFWRSLLQLILAPTWGMPLTSVSIFFFWAVDIYLEVFARFWSIVSHIIPGVKSGYPWPNHSLFQVANPLPVLRFLGFLGSSRQSMFSFALNGFLPRVIAGGGISADRAVTVGNVIWIHPEELEVLDRRRVLEVWDIAGPPDPGAGGAPLAGRPHFNDDPTKRSVVSVQGTDSSGKKRLHLSRWTRGFANTVVSMPGTNVLRFQDRPNPAGGAASPGTIHLATPLPPGFPAPDSTGSSEVIEVREFVHAPPPAAARAAVAELDTTQRFSLDLPASSPLSRNMEVEISASGGGAPVPTHGTITELVTSGSRQLGMLRHPIPARFTAAQLAAGLTVQHVIDGGAVPGSWAAVAGPVADHIQMVEPPPPPPPPRPPAPPPPPPPPWPPALSRNDLVKVKATSPTAGEDTAYVRLQTVSVTLKLAVAPAGLSNGDEVFLQRVDGTPKRAQALDPAGKPAEVTLDASASFSVNDLVSVTVESNNKVATGRVTAVAGRVLTVDPPLAGPLGLAAATRVRVQKHKDSNTGRDKAKVTAISADEIDIEVERTGLFPPKSLLRYGTGPSGSLQRIEAVRRIALHLGDETRGVAPFTLNSASLDPSARETGVRLSPAYRFLKYVSGDLPSTFGNHPAFALGVSVKGLNVDQSLFSQFFVRPTAADLPSFAQGLHVWEPLQVDADHYFVITPGLPFEEAGPDLKWHVEPNDSGHDVTITGHAAAGLQFDVEEFGFSGVTISQAGGRKVTAHPPEVQVPVRPAVHDTHRRALIEHEMHHAVQNAYWGPLMNAFPLPGLMMTVADMSIAGRESPPAWLQEVPLDAINGPPATGDARIDNNTQLNVPQLFSYGGIMQLAWKYLLLLPARLDDDARETISKKDFEFWGKLFNPVWGFLTSRLPEVDPAASAGDRWGVALLHILERATDLRSWTPFLGFVPTLLPDSGRSFLEQGASRASGDAYTSILSVDDRFNFHTHTFFVPDSAAANRQMQLGDATRVMFFPADRTDRVLPSGQGDIPGFSVTYLNRFAEQPPVEIRFTPAGNALFHPELFQHPVSAVPPTPAPTPVSIEGPPSNRAAVTFLQAGNTTVLVPALRSLVPGAPRVNRSFGFYLLPATPGAYELKGHYSGAGTRGDAETQNATITVASRVRLGNDDVLYEPPAAVGSRPTGLVLERFVTEVADLRVSGRSIRDWELEVEAPAGIVPPPVTVTNRADSLGWTLKVRKDLPPGPAPAPLRVRLFRIYKKTDPAFDLEYDDVPSLKGVRSYLEGDIWLPVRDFRLRIVDLPVLPAAAITSDAGFDLNLPIPIAGPGSLLITPIGAAPRQLAKTRTGSQGARGERWRIGPLSDPIEAPVGYNVEVTYGAPGNIATRAFVLTINPVIALTDAAGGAAFEARQGTPLVLTIAGGSAPYTSETQNVPAGSQVRVTGNRVEVTVTTAPPADQRVTVIVRDSTGKRGRRTVTLKH